jgi:hypothetical protein
MEDYNKFDLEVVLSAIRSWPNVTWSLVFMIRRGFSGAAIHGIIFWPDILFILLKTVILGVVCIGNAKGMIWTREIVTCCLMNMFCMNFW